MSGINNPFAPPPNLAVQHTAARFPDVSGDPDLQRPSPYYAQQQPQQPQFQQQQQQYYQPQQQQQPSAFLQPTQTGFQPQSSFGQQLSAQVTGIHSGYGTPGSYTGGQSPMPYGQQQQQQPSYGGNSPYGQASQGMGTPQSHPLTSDLDPYSGLGALTAQASSSPIGGSTSSAPQVGLSGQQRPSGPHPRQFVNEHKVELMSWDNYAWRQLLNTLDSLRESWEARKKLVLDAGRQGGDPSQVEGLKRQAEENIDSVHASKFQLVEVQSGWKQSTDPASKARVREALNAGLTSLPEFPSPIGAEQLGGAFLQRAQDDYRKQSILSGFSAPQQQQPQFTGWGQQPQQAYYPSQQPFQQQGYMQPQQTGFYGQPQQPFGGPSYY